MVSHKEDIVNSIIISGVPESYRESFESHADGKDSVVETDLALTLYFAYHIIRSILNGSQHFWESSRAYGIPGGRNLHVQGLVGSLMVIDRAPSVKGILGMHKVSKAIF